MLPINNNNPPCDPISSNCVIWQGPDLPCVDICAGDSISAVIAGLCSQLVILQDCCASGAGSGSIDITNINQTTLIGGPATTVDQLIQLIIDNINNSSSGSGSGTWDCDDTLRCTIGVPECLISVSSLNNPDMLSTVLTYLMNEHCADTQDAAGMVASIQGINNEVIQLKKIPQGDPNPVLRSACVDIDNKNNQPIANLVNKIEVDYCETKNNLGSPADISTALSAQPTNPFPLDSSPYGGGGFVPAIPNNPTSIAESLRAVWVLITDLRLAVAAIQAKTGTGGMLIRMVDINTFYAGGTGCAEAKANGVTGGAFCVDLWNSTGIEFDTSVRAYSEPAAEAGYELLTGYWYALCPGTGLVAQYLGGATGTKSAPFWTTPVPTCA